MTRFPIKTVTVLLLVCMIVVPPVLGPMVYIWAMNTLFKLNIAYNMQTFVAMNILLTPVFLYIVSRIR